MLCYRSQATKARLPPPRDETKSKSSPHTYEVQVWRIAGELSVTRCSRRKRESSHGKDENSLATMLESGHLAGNEIS